MYHVKYLAIAPCAAFLTLSLRNFVYLSVSISLSLSLSPSLSLSLFLPFDFRDGRKVAGKTIFAVRPATTTPRRFSRSSNLALVRLSAIKSGLLSKRRRFRAIRLLEEYSRVTRF